MTIDNKRPRVVSIPRPSIEMKNADGSTNYNTTGHVFLTPGLNAISAEDAEWLSKHPGIVRRVKSGELKVLDGDSDPLSGSVENVVAGVEKTLDRPTLEALRERDKRKPVLAAIDAQLKKLTDHRSAA